MSQQQMADDMEFIIIRNAVPLSMVLEIAAMIRDRKLPVVERTERFEQFDVPYLAYELVQLFRVGFLG